MTLTLTDVDRYLAALPSAQRQALAGLRATLHATSPDLEERMSSGAPFVWFQGRRALGFGAARDHLSLYIMHGRVLQTHRFELAGLDVSRTVVRFTPERPLPEALVRRLLRARLDEIAATRSR